ncbi:hypothetical protein CVD25_09950 [Bacillus canaveralius]|uniref:HTH cro/C1-type domain-containing protein n=1 Tax=Bacillus canaveralius TaxID=1403243 RepID=A0A2N5GMG0_9BACI|nr:TniQ family protein [Bacillus canaveralius]PLR83036.1 hypothetical protein CU635_11250 [Bacillus canaveralius]PLR96960.1 hypothetical protein CVD25_09950 [Bacillus canaveralius]
MDNLNFKSQLYNLEPIGIGTIYCESLTSYLVRLSQAHSVNLGTLLNKVVAPALKKEYVLNSAMFGGNRFFDGAKALNGVSDSSMDLVNALQLLTGRKDLIYLTLKTWDEVLTSRGLLKESIAWCPLCLHEFRLEHRYIFYPLAWYMEPVRCCLIHNILLLDKCQNCGNDIPILHRSSVNGCCPHCKHGLFLVDGNANKTRDNHKDIYVAENLANIVSIGPKLEIRLSRELISQRFNLLIDVYERNFLLDLSFPKVTVHNWLHGDAIPTIQKLLDICYALGVSLTDFFLQDNLKPNLVVEKIQYNTSTHERRNLDHLQIEKQLLSYIELSKPMSMVAIAKDMNVNKRTLYRILPELCKKLSKRYKEFMGIKSDERKQTIKNLIKRSVQELIENGKKPSQKNIERLLSANALLRERFAKEYLQKCLNNQNLGD